MDGQRLGVRLSPPRRNQHADALLASVGYSPAEIDALRSARAIPAAVLPAVLPSAPLETSP